jgi:hypothetical protein
MCNPSQLFATRVLQRSLSTLPAALLAHPSQLPSGCAPYQKKRNESKGKQKSLPPPFHHLTSAFASRGPHTLSLSPCLHLCLPRYLPTLPPSPIGADPIARPGSPHENCCFAPQHDLTRAPVSIWTPRHSAARRGAAAVWAGDWVFFGPGRAWVGFCAMLCYAMLCCQRCWISMLLRWEAWTCEGRFLPTSTAVHAADQQADEAEHDTHRNFDR